MNRERFAKRYMWGIAVVGLTITGFSIFRLPVSRLDLRFLFLGLMLAVASQIGIRIPRVSGRITASDTLIFLTMLLYGGEAAVLLSAVDGACSSLRITRKTRTVLFNSGMLATSTALTVWVLRPLFGRLIDIVQPDYSANFIVAICVMALVQYIANTVLVAIEKANKIEQPVWTTWRKFYLWTSVTYFAGASAAGIIAHLIRGYGFYAVIATVPIVAIIYLTYDTYLKNIEASEAQADLAQRHVDELSGYIGELKRSEEERGQLLLREQQARAEAEAANRSKDEFLATLSHELRTPLTSLLGWANLLRTSGPSEALMAQGLEAIERNARSQTQLIDDLLDVSRIISGKLRIETQPVDMSAVIEAAISVVLPAADAKSIQLRYRHRPMVRPVSGDPARLQQVIWNLLSNAVKFTPKGGRVDITLKQLETQTIVIVQDNGKGIGPELLPHVFDRFRQGDSSTTRAYGGLGLGLGIVRHLVELHGGAVSAESEGEGKGSVFSVMFPPIISRNGSGSYKLAAQSNGDETLVSSAMTLRGLRVLVVDDESDTLELLRTMIELSGADVRTCESAREALEMLKDWMPDVLMSDIGMPGEDGYALIKKVRSLSPETGGRIPAAALTAYARKEDRARALAAGFQEHLAKPISSDQLLGTIAHLAAISNDLKSDQVKEATELGAQRV
jgi:signal transduction histidine kinase/FixJ family two-component response regulator